MKFSIPTVCLGKQADRFATYREDITLEEKFALASKIEGLEGVGVFYPTEVDNADKIKELCSKNKLKISEVIVDVFTSPKFKYGSFTNPSADLRKEAIKITKEAMGVAKELNCVANPWPGQDGHDYIFQVNYEKAWKWLINGIKECAEYEPKVRLAVEYKIKEPRTHIILGTVGTSLYLCQKVGMPNVGITLDTGHCFMANENPAEAAVMLSMENRLFNIHVNDNYGDWDWDLVPGTISTPSQTEFLFWLKAINYNDWILIDVFPQRLEPLKVFNRAIRNTKRIEQAIDKIGIEKIKEKIEKGDILETFSLLEKL